MKKGILLVNLGTPDAPERKEVYKYLKQFLLDKRVIDIPWLKRNLLVRGIIAPFRSKSSSELYKKLWTADGSPIKIYGHALEKGVAEILGDAYAVKLAMRYQSPSIESSLNELLRQNIESLTVLPLFPQYASASTGSVMEEVMRLLSKEQAIPPIKILNGFASDPRMIALFANNARKYDLSQYEHFVFSFHGLPQRQLISADRNNHCLKSDDCCENLCDKNHYCYSAQCYSTAHAIVKELNIDKEKYTICFQSRLGNDPWTQPPTPVILEGLLKKGVKKVLVFSPAFVADCLETTIEIEHEYREDFIKGGGEILDMVESLNDNPEWIKAVAGMVAS